MSQDDVKMSTVDDPPTYVSTKNMDEDSDDSDDSDDDKPLNMISTSIKTLNNDKAATNTTNTDTTTTTTINGTPGKSPSSNDEDSDSDSDVPLNILVNKRVINENTKIKKEKKSQQKLFYRQSLAKICDPPLL